MFLSGELSRSRPTTGVCDEARLVTRTMASSPAALMVGTLEPGRMADVVLWSANPFSVYALADRVWIDGAPVWDRADPALQRPSDFLLGQPGQEAAR